MSNLDLSDLCLEYRIITDRDKDRDNNCGYIPIPKDNLVAGANFISIVNIIPPNTRYQLRIKKKSQDQWHYCPIQEPKSDNVVEVGISI